MPLKICPAGLFNGPSFAFTQDRGREDFAQGPEREKKQTS
jgi:hypothetical protein